MKNKINFGFALIIFTLLTIGLASAYYPYPTSVAKIYSPVQESYSSEANFIDPWGNQVVAFKRNIKPHYSRENMMLIRLPNRYIIYRAHNEYRYMSLSSNQDRNFNPRFKKY